MTMQKISAAWNVNYSASHYRVTLYVVRMKYDEGNSSIINNN